MKLLAIDTSTDIASVALLLGDKLLQNEQGSQKTHAQFLLPMIDALMREADLPMEQLDAIVFGCGPGSFTGLRIACSTAKALAYAHELSLIPVSSLAAICWAARQQLPNTNEPVLAVLDARMQEMYWAYYDSDLYQTEERVSSVKNIKLPEKPESVILAGVGIEEYWDDFPEIVRSQVSRQMTIYPTAAGMIELAKATAIAPISAAEAQPVYVRNQVTHDKNS